MAQSGNSDADPISTQPAAEEVTVERTPEEEASRLRYLEFVQQAAAQAVVLAATAYANAKQGAGPLRPGVDHVEGTVKAVVGPIYDRYHAVPLDLLKFLDRKDKVVNLLFEKRPKFWHRWRPKRICKDLSSIGDTVIIFVTKEGVKFSTAADIGTANTILHTDS
ncbi:hypothetical protein ACQJBY_057750 [Aegilops geniculata]